MITNPTIFFSGFFLGIQVAFAVFTIQAYRRSIRETKSLGNELQGFLGFIREQVDVEKRKQEFDAKLKDNA